MKVKPDCFENGKLIVRTDQYLYCGGGGWFGLGKRTWCPMGGEPIKRAAEPKWVPMPGEPIKREANPEWVPMPGEPIKREAEPEAKWVPMPGEPIKREAEPYDVDTPTFPREFIKRDANPDSFERWANSTISEILSIWSKKQTIALLLSRPSQTRSGTST